MKHIKAITCATLTILVAAGCGAGDDGRSGESVELDAASSAAPEAGENAELARIEFSDGNVVQFEELAGGVLVSELGPLVNPRHLVPKQGLTALEAFKTLAPGREVPAALLRLHEHLYSTGETAENVESARVVAPAGEDLPSDPDLEHNGEFQQFYPADYFLQVACDFPTGNGSYKHTNRTDAHNDISMNVHSIYYAVASDRGSITAQPCVGKNEGGLLNGQCGSAVAIAAGTGRTGFYDAGKAYNCSKGGGVEICIPNLKRFELRYGKVSPSVNFHECAQVSRVLTD
jgi:hypothetical protein